MADREDLGKRGRYHHGDLRRALVAASMMIIEEEGVDGLTLRAVARRTGVSHAAPYRHFVDKEALLVEVAVEGCAMLRDYMEDAMAALGDRASAAARLHAANQGYVRFASEHTACFRVMFGPYIVDRNAHEPLGEASSGAQQVLAAALEACYEAQEVASGASEVDALAVWAMVHGFAGLMISRQLPGPMDVPRRERLVHAMTERLLGGLRGEEL